MLFQDTFNRYFNRAYRGKTKSNALFYYLFLVTCSLNQRCARKECLKILYINNIPGLLRENPFFCFIVFIKTKKSNPLCFKDSVGLCVNEI